MAQESPKKAQAVLIFDGEDKRITEWRFSPEAETGWHRHEFDYAVVPLSDGAVKIFDGTTTTEVPMRKDSPYFRKAGVEHNVINASGEDFAFIEIEWKR